MSDSNEPQGDLRGGLTRRRMLAGSAVLAGSVVASRLTALPGQSAQKPAAAVPSVAPPPVVVRPLAPPDAALIPGAPSGPLGLRSPYENPALAPVGVTTGSTLTPLHALHGTITPSDLHFQRHHNGIPLIDPERWSLMVHGLVDKPLSLSLAELQRFPAITRPYFIECSGNGRAAYRAPKKEMTAQEVDGLTSNSEWTGVPVWSGCWPKAATLREWRAASPWKN